jgi:Mrp family chromosome partitioning ATPase
MGFEWQHVKFSTLQPSWSHGEFDYNGDFTDIAGGTDSSSTGRADFLLTPTTTTAAGGVNYVGGSSDIRASNIGETDDGKNYYGGYINDAAGSIVSVADNLRHAGAAGQRLAVFGALPGINTSQMAIKLARLLADDSRGVLVGLASGDTAIRGISNEPSAPGLAELACGAATFGSIITKDKFSPLHLIAAGQGLVDRVGVLAAPGMVTSFNALARAYDHVVIDAGEAAGAEIERISEIAPNAVLITDMLANAATTSARDRLLAAGFGDVRILVGGYGTSGETAAAA